MLTDVVVICLLVFAYCLLVGRLLHLRSNGKGTPDLMILAILFYVLGSLSFIVGAILVIINYVVLV